MTYPTLAVVNATTDITQLLVYMNLVTDGYAGPLIAWSFFVVAFLGNLFATFRFRGRPKTEVSFFVASFITLIFSLFMMLEPGLLHYKHSIFFAIMTIIGFFWVQLAQEH